ncbi:hypothetical protein BGZ57DRAFT_957971 [Hyaloscypha finlandica]|nr:hypothetical protein BGZ57DRAFT_957971 [Hyaloscypha finlandica]KAH8772222.1 hypothetical protein F5882DRAFT_465147 [Hyaloscypha sp. PMI_1271]
MYFTRLFVFAATAQAISVNYALDHRDVVEGYSSNVSGDILFGDAVQSGLASIQPFRDSVYVEFPIPSLTRDTNKGGLLLKCPYTSAMACFALMTLTTCNCLAAYVSYNAANEAVVSRARVGSCGALGVLTASIFVFLIDR